MKKKLLIVAGEVSGDLHAAEAFRELKKQLPEISAWGIGGDALSGEGVRLLEHTDRMAVMGFAEVLRHYRFLKGAFQRVLDEVERHPPAAALLVDYPGFNLRLAAELKQRGIPVFYYISPKVWAWNKKRIPKMAQIIDHLMVVFPFEKELFRKTTLKVEFVGNPLVGQIDRFLQTEWERLPWKTSPWIALLPGSRKQEIDRILPPMLSAVRRLQQNHPHLSCIIPAPSSRIRQYLESRIAKISDKPTWTSVTEGNAREVLRQAEAALVASGTATLEAALIGTPHLLVYKTDPLTYWFARSVVKISHIGLVNIIAGRTITPELIQKEAAPKPLAEKLEQLLEPTPQREEMLAGFAQVRNLLGEKDAAAEVARILFRYLSAPAQKTESSS